MSRWSRIPALGIAVALTCSFIPTQAIAANSGSPLAAANVDFSSVSTQADVAPQSSPLIKDLFVKQETSRTCTLAAATIMVRSRFFVSHNDAWKNITESSLKPSAWSSRGLSWQFNYSAPGGFLTVNHSNLMGTTLDALKDMIWRHPEGVVLYAYNSSRSAQHAVVVTDVEGDTVYCADPANMYNGRRIPLESSWMGRLFGSQKNILKRARGLWYVSAYGITPTNQHVQPHEEANETQDYMHRLYNIWSGEHFYTASEEETDRLLKLGWRYENKAWIAPKESEVPVYRLYNSYSGDHHYTTDAAERDNLVSVGWNDEGIGWYSAPAESGRPVFREFNPYVKSGAAGSHNFTLDAKEDEYLGSVGWSREGIGWYSL